MLPGAGAQALDPVAQLPGYWGWDMSDLAPEDRQGSCADSPMRIWFEESGTRYNSQHVGDEQIATAPILLSLPSTEASGGFLIRYDGEDRLDDAGRPVEWLLVMESADAFYWVRLDWIDQGNRTRYMVRCDEALIG